MMQFQNEDQAIAWAKKQNMVIGFWKQKVIQLGHFATLHPGGEKVILDAQNKNIYQLFNTTHKHLPLSQNIAIGLTRAILKNKPSSSQKKLCCFNFKKPLLQQVSSFTTQQYMASYQVPIIVNQNVRLFSSDFMQWFTHNSLFSVLSSHLPVSLLLMYFGMQTLIVQGLLMFLLYIIFGGLILWTSSEYILHRFLFHFQLWLIPRGSILKYTHFIIHGVHHIIPMDLDRIVFPPIIGLIIESILGLIFFSIFSQNRAFVLAAGFDMGYMTYQIFHYSMHIRNFSFMKKRRRDHNIHHYIIGQINFGVTNNIYDKMFGTYQKP